MPPAYREHFGRPGRPLGSRVVSNAVEVTGLRVEFPQSCAVDDVTLNVDYGEVVTLLGPNGAGKTTLVETLLGFRAPTAGTVRLHGLDPLRDHAEVVVRTGALLQRGGVWFPMTPRQVLHLTASYYDAPSDTEELVDCPRSRAVRAHAVATPERRRAAAHLARARAARTTSGAGARRAHHRRGPRGPPGHPRPDRRRARPRMRAAHHDPRADRGRAHADRLVIMNRGHVVVEGTLDELAGAPEMIIEVAGPVDPAALGALLGVAVTLDGPTPVALRRRRHARARRASSPRTSRASASRWSRCARAPRSRSATWSWSPRREAAR